MNIILKENMVKFYSMGADSPIYYFKKKELGKTIRTNGYEVSEWIDHLSRKTWIEEFDLYNLAVLIQKKVPKNIIDWENTFYPVEKNLFIDDLIKFHKDNLDPNKKSNSLFKSVIMQLKLGIELEKDNNNNEILEKLRSKLNHYGLNK